MSLRELVDTHLDTLNQFVADGGINLLDPRFLILGKHIDDIKLLQAWDLDTDDKLTTYVVERYIDTSTILMRNNIYLHGVLAQTLGVVEEQTEALVLAHQTMDQLKQSIQQTS